MGNIGSGLFATPQERELRKLTKKNTKVNRMALGSTEADASQPAMRRDPDRKEKLTQPLRFENLITEVTYDREEGEIEITREMLNHESEDALGNDVLLELVPNTVPVVCAIDHPSSPTSPTREPPPRRTGGVLKRDSSFISAHAPRHSAAITAAASSQVAGEPEEGHRT